MTVLRPSSFIFRGRRVDFQSLLAAAWGLFSSESRDVGCRMEFEEIRNGAPVLVNVEIFVFCDKMLEFEVVPP